MNKIGELSGKSIIVEQTPGILKLEGGVQHYPWGGFNFIPGLLGQENPKSEPYAELWMGAHPSNPSHLRFDGLRLALNDHIEQSPESLLGLRVSRRFNRRLPFLFKVLDVRRMLSIQAHPNKRQAEAGFQHENKQGIPLDAPNRIFRDDNHKPELVVALTDFWLLHGFRSVAAIRQTLQVVPELEPLSGHFVQNDLEGLYRYIMELPQAEINRMLSPLANRLKAESEAGQLSKDQPEYWAAQAFADYTSPQGDYDRGVFSIFLLNLVHIQPGEGVFQDAGIPHAYLEGVNVELMANSDNVFRGGLTPKHIDVAALIEHLNFQPVTPRVIHGLPVSPTEFRYPTPAPDFELSRIRIVKGQTHHQPAIEAPQILIVLEDSVTTHSGKRFNRGDSFLVKAGSELILRSDGLAVLYKATVPVPVEPEIA